jgi:cell shape-determining protein MreC
MTVAVDDDASHDTLVAAVNELYERVERLEDENEQLRDELAEERERSARERADVRADLHDLTETVESHDDAETEPSGAESSPSNPKGQTGEDGEDGPTNTPPSPKTALEDTLRLPDGVASDSLSANQRRARSVARDISDYAEFNHEYGNYSLTAKRLRIVLKAQSDDETAAHHETVKRVRKFLNRLGESEVTVTEDRGGTKRLVFAESLVERIESYTDAEAHGAVRHDTVGTGVET